MSNFLGFVQSKKNRDIFFPEESEMLTYLKEYCGEKEDIDGTVRKNKTTH